ncbi:polymorphic toxin type 33 domain-containing protein [Mucilaginibacter sp. OK268]|uniref:DUF6443 domain-containing protein n=1 Tax=Mucilaginibacter sp. OK268 TaxID=1881048 RepID=UPI0015A1BAAD|nr:polymorphic toxin type 33 domain-containing protein [Mucilaginibacter sp. OK268]
MKTQSYSNHRILGKLFLAILMILISQEIKAQYIASPAQLGIPATTPGNYYNETSITLSPGFSATATSTNSYSYFIQTSCVPLSINLSQSQNYILTSVPREAGIDPEGNNTNCKLMQTVQYFDGLGRLLQTVQVKGSPSSKDIVQPVTYDQFGREAKKYLPYTITNGASDGSYKSDALTVNAGQDQFYKSPPAGVSIIPYPSESTGFEPSPLNRVVEQGASGQPWQLSTSGVTGSGHTIQMAYGSNVTDDAVIMWVVNASGTGAAGSSNYGVNQLYKTTTTDENGNSTIEFTDKKGHVVCRKAQSGATSYLATYYIYDDFDNLAYVIPPLPAGTVYPASFTEADAVFTNFIYGYHYDLRNREIEKKIPGKASWEYMVYNKLDQLVATQDGIQRAKSTQEWSFTKYDQFGRVAYWGVYQYPGSTPGTNYRAALQSMVDGQTTLWETQQTTGTGYSGMAWPQANILRYLVLNYYDNYTFPNKPYSPVVSNTLTNPTGLPTATKTAVLLPDGTYGSMLWTVNFYDDRGRLVQTDKQHYLGGEASLNTLNYDEIDNIYNFNDQVKTTNRHHYVANSQSLLVTTNYQYDHMGRKMLTSEAISSGLSQAPLPTIISQLDYNEIGQLKTKHLHSTNNGGSYLQDVSYTYNERGWLSQINDPSVAPTANKLFSEKLNYNLPQFGAQAQFNGNIAEQQYNAGISGNQHVNYSYDNLSRLKAGVSTAGFSETISNYDNLGNIQGLTRTAPNTATLTYNYIGNQLQTVTNSGAAFRNYGYDPNGNATSDGQGNAILYNMINLPRSIASKNLNYAYSATGEKLRKNSNSSITEYIGGIQYRPDGTIDFVQTEEGRANRSGANYIYEYTLTDHLGNNRVTFDQTNGKVGEDDYYPFGLNVHRQVNGGNKYLYNNKELQEELNQYDYGARFYDPVIARWTSVDPMAESSRRFSPFIYGNNNPIRFIDPDGMFAGLGAPWKPNNDLDDQKKDPFSGMLTNVADPIDPTQQSKVDNEATSQIEDENNSSTNPEDDGGKKGNGKDGDSSNDRNPAQDKPLTPSEIDQLEKAGFDHRDKSMNGKKGGRLDLYKDKKGNVYEKPKGNKGPGEPIGYNLNNLFKSKEASPPIIINHYPSPPAGGLNPNVGKGSMLGGVIIFFMILLAPAGI